MKHAARLATLLLPFLLPAVAGADDCSRWFHDPNAAFSFPRALGMPEALPDGRPVRGAPGSTLYRGYKNDDPRMGVAHFVRAALGYVDASISSRTFDDIQTFVLTGVAGWVGGKANRRFPFEIDPQLEADARILRQCVLVQPLLFAVIPGAVAGALDRYFERRAAEGRLVPLYADEETTDYRNWMSEGIFLSHQPDVAALYGGTTLIVHPKARRGLDREAYAILHAPERKPSRNRADRSEILYPGYILPEEVYGLDLKTTDHRLLLGIPNRKIRHSLRMIQAGGTRAALVLDAEGRDCVREGSDGRFYGCRVNRDRSAWLIQETPLPETTENLVPVIGAYSICIGKACDALHAYLSTYGKTAADTLPVAPPVPFHSAR